MNGTLHVDIKKIMPRSVGSTKTNAWLVNTSNRLLDSAASPARAPEEGLTGHLDSLPVTLSVWYNSPRKREPMAYRGRSHNS